MYALCPSLEYNTYIIKECSHRSIQFKKKSTFLLHYSSNIVSCKNKHNILSCYKHKVTHKKYFLFLIYITVLIILYKLGLKSNNRFWNDNCDYIV